MKSKTKTNKEKKYPAYYLATILATVLILEGILLGVATPHAWEKGLEILDVSSGVEVVMSDVSIVTEPMFVQFNDIEQFYQMAASETIALFDTSHNDPLMFVKGVNKFYQLASIEMEKMLDVSDNFQYFPQVAGASVFR